MPSPVLKEWLCVEDVLWDSETLSPRATRARCSSSVLSVSDRTPPAMVGSHCGLEVGGALTWPSSLASGANELESDHKNGACGSSVSGQSLNKQVPSSLKKNLGLVNGSHSYMVYMLFRLVFLHWVLG